MSVEKVLVVVESPKKAKTISSFLSKSNDGRKYDVLASYGHVRDLIPKNGAVDTEHGFKMNYEVLQDQKKHVDKIVKSAKKSDLILLAPDPDREGEAIAWHILHILCDSQAKIEEKVARVVFYQVTKNAVLEAIQSPRKIEPSLVNAQQARRALDYLVGFNISPLLWRKIRPGLSAGRVQSPALRLIVEREDEINAFIPKEYWDFEAITHVDSQAFKAKLTHFKKEKLEQFSFTSEAQAKAVEQTINSMDPQSLTASKVTKKQRKRNPSAPFTTSTLQQDASRKLGFGTSKTMRIAQQLYEGIEINSEQVGLITYMRTDSVSLAKEAIAAIRQHVTKAYGENYIPDKPNFYKTKSKNAQEAHEAIRPSEVHLTPQKVQKFLDKDQQRLYTLIWQRAVASQMSHAVFDQVQVDLTHTDICQFRASGSTINFPGFLSVYDSQDEQDHKLPEIEEGMTVPIDQFSKNQHFTEPPPRFSEASLVKTLEEYGIGRPSTFTSIISTLVKREYVSLDNKRFFATDVGRYVNRFLTMHFPKYVDYEFTAQLEENLDEVSRNEREWVPVLDEFWRPLDVNISSVDESVSRQDATEIALDENCPECTKPLVRKLSKAGTFIACTGYPDCRYTRNENEENEEKLDKQCPECEHPLTYKYGRYGKFIGCTNYPDCKYIEKMPDVVIDVTCPKCNEGKFIQRKSRRGSTFYACNRFPKCKNAISHEPVSQSCEQCNHPIMMRKETKKNGIQFVCPECKHTVDANN
tara:strand:+ start:3671 stop:5926 length:2256 start_codon:yes stop_codon:yes gene_type:complete